MGNDFEDFVATRCEEALTRDVRYMEMQRQLSIAYQERNIELYSNLSVKLQSIVETVVYQAAVHDVGKIFVH